VIISKVVVRKDSSWRIRRVKKNLAWYWSNWSN